MKDIEVWRVEVGSTMHTAESKTYHVQASNPGTAAKRALAIARHNYSGTKFEEPLRL